MDNQDALKRIAYLEFANDQLHTELTEIDELLRGIGFSEGIITVKEIAIKLINEGYTDALDYEFEDDEEAELEL